MPLVVRINSGARAGSGERFDKPVVVVGRVTEADLRFDPMRDLDVSSKHAELRLVADGVYEVVDLGSTNGTFVNGVKVEGKATLKNKDKVKFGANGPEIEVQFRVTGSSGTVTGPSGAVKKASTEERVAFAVKQQTAGLRRMMMVAMGVVAVGLVAAYLIGQRGAKAEVERLRQMLEANDARIRTFQNSVPDDTALANELTRQLRALRDRLPGATTDDERAVITADIAKLEAKMSGLIRMDLSTINEVNKPAVAILVSQIKGQNFSGTAFGITPDGLLLTNRHNVRNADGDTSTKIAVKFVGTKWWLPARIVKVSNDADVDLALIQMDEAQIRALGLERPAKYPTVTGLQAKDGNAGEGASVGLIGFPFGMDTPQEGDPGEFVAKSTLNAGMVSKRTTSVLQIDSHAGHGSSGSPVFSASGLVVGVVWGGAAESGGRIVYAVPPDKVAAFLGPQYAAVIKD